MSYTKAFNQLYRLSQVMDNLRTRTQYARVAIYVGRVMMAETAITKKDDETRNLDSPITTDMNWVTQVAGHKDMMIEHFLEINDYEWKLIRESMHKYADQSRGSEIWHRRRLGMIIDLETLRVFHLK